MFKLVSLTALIASTHASAAAGDTAEDKSKLKAEYEKQQAAAKKYAVSESTKIWTEAKDKKSWSFMARPDTTYAIKGAVEAQTCMDCHMTGDLWDAKTKKCGVHTTKKEKPTEVTKDDKADAALDHDVTYEDFLNAAFACADTDQAHCKEDFDLATFEKEPSTGKKGNKPYTWSYGYDAAATPAWSTCAFKATMPQNAKKEYEWKGGLLLSHTLPTDDIQAIVQVQATTSHSYLYNSFTLSKLSVGKTNKVVIPAAHWIDVVYTNTEELKTASTFSISFERQTAGQLAEFTLEHGGVIVWVIIGIVVFCLLCVGIIVWKKCFHKDNDAFYVDDAYARV